MINEATTSKLPIDTDKKPLPKGWKWVKLGDVCYQDKKIIEPTSVVAKKLPYLSLEHIKSETGQILKEPDEPLSDSGKSTTFLFDNQHILYSKLRPYLNKVALPDFTGRCTTELIPILPSEKTTREFIAWVLRRKEVVELAMQNKTGSRMPRADLESLFAMEIPLPPLHEQKRIAAILAEQMAAVEQARKAAKEQLEAAKALPAAYLQEVFEGEEAKGWERKKLGEIAETCSGSTPSRSNPDYYKGNIPWVKTGELKDSSISDTEEHINEIALKESSVKMLPKGTLLVAMYGQGQTRGRTGLLLNPATTNQACFAVLPNYTKFVPEFLQFWFRHNYLRLRRETEGRGGNQPNLNGAVLNSQQITLPAILKQEQIIKLLEEKTQVSQHIINTLSYQLEVINKLPSVLLQRAFSGEL